MKLNDKDKALTIIEYLNKKILKSLKDYKNIDDVMLQYATIQTFSLEIERILDEGL